MNSGIKLLQAPLKVFFYFKKFIKDILYVLGHDSKPREAKWNSQQQNDIKEYSEILKECYSKNCWQQNVIRCFQIKSLMKTKLTHSFTLCLNLSLRYIFFFLFLNGSPLEQMEFCAWASPVWAHAVGDHPFQPQESSCCIDYIPVQRRMLSNSS